MIATCEDCRSIGEVDEYYAKSSQPILVIRFFLCKDCAGKRGETLEMTSERRKLVAERKLRLINPC